MSKAIVHRHTDEIVCPWCGYKHGDSWEMGDEDTHECDECENTFSHYRDIEVTYTTWKEEDNV